jgi:head-tail adaptor
MQASDLKLLLAFDAPAPVGNGQGGMLQGWIKQYQCRAHIRFLRGTETVIAARLAGRQPVVITVRNCAAARAVTIDWRIRDLRSALEYNVRTAPVPSQDRIWLEILAESGVPV